MNSVGIINICKYKNVKIGILYKCIFIYPENIHIQKYINIYDLVGNIYQVKSSQVCFIVNSSTCTAHIYRELKLHYSLTLGAYS